MPALEYASLTKTQKLAAFLVLIGPEDAAVLLKQLPDGELENVVREMAALEVIDFDIQEKVMQEFCELIGQGMSSVLGGVHFAQRALERAKGPQIASNILQKAMPPNNSIEAVRELAQLEVRQLHNLMKREQPQTIAFVLSYLEPRKVTEAFLLFDDATRENIIESLGSMESISSSLITKVLGGISKGPSIASQKQVLHERGGVGVAAQLLNSLEKDVSKAILTKLQERNADLTDAIRQKLFTFDDIGRLNSRDIQRILREVESADLALALKGAKENIRQSIYGAMSKRAAEGLREELSLLGPTRMKDIEAAQGRVVQKVRELIDGGEVNPPQEGAADVVE
jgi:flagellar motor switch protein FliG